jgi:hypothetical protein
MNKTIALSLSLFAVGIVAVAATVEFPTKPSAEYQNIMRNNASLVDLAAGNGNAAAATGGGSRETNIEVRVTGDPGSKTLRDLYKDKDYEGIARGAEQLKANYDKLNAFWTEKKAADAIGFAETGSKAAADMIVAAKAKSDKEISKAQTTIERTCRDCHTNHRVVMLTDTSFQIRISPNLF